jgi:hypothetical protein
MFTFHTNRIPDFWTLWYASGSILHLDVTGDGYRRFVDVASLIAFGAWSIYCLHLQRLAARDAGAHAWKNPWFCTGAILSAFLLLSKVSSPQFSLWLLPVLVVCRVPLPLVILYFCVDLASTFSGSRFFADGARHDSGWRTLLIVFTLCKMATLGLLAGSMASQLRMQIRTHRPSTDEQGFGQLPTL